MTWLFWSFLSAVFAAVTAILAKFGVEGVDSNMATAIRTSVVVCFAWAVALVLPGSRALPSNARTWTFLALSGVATALSWLCYFRALQLGPVSKVAPVDKLSVLLVILFGALFLGERMTPGKVAGAVAILFGIWAVALE